MDFDVIVIGSGFGGAISGCRLAERGAKVLILERGRWWTNKPDEPERTRYPRAVDDRWIWDQDKPEKDNGWLDFRMFSRIAVAQGAAVGGGSLIYANVSVEAPPDAFAEGWPAEVEYEELKPYYDTVAEFMNVQKVPDNQWPNRSKLMKEGATEIGAGDRFEMLDLAVSFDKHWSYDHEDPRNHDHSKSFVNAQGVEQGTCVHLGECDIGCPVRARNTLDLNYIPWAIKHGAEVRQLHLVSNIEPIEGGYRVHYDRLENRRRMPGSQTAKAVVVAAGSLGSTELLLRCRDGTRSLPNISRRLGHGWCSNGDFLTPALYPSDRDVSPTWGPTITSAINFLDRSRDGESFWIEDGGFPDLLEAWFESVQANPPKGLVARALIESIQHTLRQDDPLKCTMPWFAQGVDKAGGTFELKRPWWRFFWGHKQLKLGFDSDAAEGVINAIIKTHEALSEATGGRPFVPFTWTRAKYLVTPHPLGGCNMGNTAADGVVDHVGQVFGYPRLFVVDGAIIPKALGVNPSRTIGALAERSAKTMIDTNLF